jgi:hypothetical protein
LKTYYIRLTEADFTKDNNTWTSPIIDLYDTANLEYPLAEPGYRNYSSVKSAFGTNLLGNNVWTGLEDASPNTDSGFISGDRFIDTSARVDIINYEFSISNTPGDVEVGCTLNAHTIDDPTVSFPDDWTSKTDITSSRPIFIIKSYRYARFVLNLISNQFLTNASVEVLIKVHIGPPVMTPLYDRTGVILDMFPEWMEMRELDYEPATPALATPNSLAGSFINALAGEWLDDLTQELKYQRLQQYIDTANTGQAAWIYGSFDVPDYIWSIKGDGEELINTVSQQDFYALTPDEHGYWWSQEKNAVYTQYEYASLTINNEVIPQIPVHVWNWFDEFGLIVDLKRLHLEPNLNFKHRILDVYKNKPGVGVAAFKLALRRELDLWRLEGATPNIDHYSLGSAGATPDSNFAGATPDVIEIFDLEKHPDYVTPDGLPKDKFKALVDYLANKYPVTWGYFKWDDAIWDVGGGRHEGFAVMPYAYDTEQLAPEYIQSGVGDGDDLYVYRPDVITGPREFNAQFKTRGRYRQYRDEYPAVDLEVRMYGEANKELYDNPEISTWVTVVVQEDADTPATYFYEELITLHSNIDVENVTGTPNADVSVVYAVEGANRTDLTWYDEDGVAYSYENGNEINFDIGEATLKLGRKDFSNPASWEDPAAWIDFPSDNLDVWFGSDSSNTLNSVINSDDFLIGSASEDLFVVRSHETTTTIGTWRSTPQTFNIKLNGANPSNALENMLIDLPAIIWNEYLEDPPEKKYVIEFVTVDNAGNYAGITSDAEGGTLYLAAENIYVNGDSAWVDGKLYFDVDSVTEFEFSTGEPISPAYPVNAPYWTLFENTQTSSIYGIVDENGPWRNNQRQSPGNTNFHLEPVELTRSDFGIPESEDYVVTWMGVECDNGGVLVWIDSNTIHPVFEDSTIDYPTDAIVEIYDEDSGTYYFESFILRARLRPGIEPQWYPHLNSGYFYEKDKEYYAYSRPVDETATTSHYVLGGVVRQGAPIIAETSDATPYRQVAFYDEDTETLSLTNKEIVSGNGSNYLYAAYNDIYDIQIKNLDSMQLVLCDLQTTSNEIWTVYETSYDKEYELTYKVRYSFYADNDYIHTDDTPRTKLVFDQVTSANINYESSRFDPATPIDIPLNPFYTTMNEGFIFLSHEEYDLAGVEVRLSPAHLIADGEDHSYLTMRSVDNWGNPKSNGEFTLTTDFGTFVESEATTVSVVTDRDGFAVVTLLSEDGTSSLSGTITITGEVSGQISFTISPVEERPYNLIAVTTSDAIPADGKSKVAVHGILLDPSHQPVSHATISYRKARSQADLFTMAYNEEFQPLDSTTPVWPDAGLVLSDEGGRFSIGPFTAATPFDPGYWFLATESDEGDPEHVTPSTYDITGDVVFWVEYPDGVYGIDMSNLLQTPMVQSRIRAEDNVPMTDEVAFPINYDEATPNSDATPVIPNWLPPEWYALPKYTQYQLGMLGSDYYLVEIADLLNSHPDYKDF